MEVVLVLPGVYQASYLGVSVIGVSFGDAVQACIDELSKLS